MKPKLATAPLTILALFGLVACSAPAQAPTAGQQSPNVAGAQSPGAQQAAGNTAAARPADLVQSSEGATVLRIQPGASTASFTVDEILRGLPNTVVGTTNQVSGEISLDAGDPTSTKVGTITVDARTLATDDNQRNNMLHCFILATSDFNFVSFTPTTITGLPSTITAGMAYPVRIDGKLTIKDTTRDAIFDANVIPMSDGELKGNATTTISQKDYGITIPQIPFVAGVADNVRLDLEFVATA